jgi:hypothetical protein
VRTPLAIIVVLLAVLVPLGFLTDDGPDGGGAAGSSEAGSAGRTTPVPTIARRVEAIRRLRYEAVPRPQRVTPATATREGLADLDRGYPLARRRADEALYTLVGLLPPGTDLRKVNQSVFGEQIAGYYDPTRKRLRIVQRSGGEPPGARPRTGTANRVLDEMVIAHELDHALEDQAIGLRTALADRSDDAGLAYKALVEGAATEVMYDYLSRHFRSDVALGGLFGGALGTGGTGDLPRFITDGLTFPYVEGQRFVATLLRRADRRWTLVDLAERTRPPVSTEQVLHPEKWIAVEVPDEVRLPDLGARLGGGWSRLTQGTFGEWQTAEVLSQSGTPSARAADGWGGDRYELWRQGSGPCDVPCPARDVLVMRWTWDTRADAAEFRTALAETLTDGLHARPAGEGRWTLRGAAVAVDAAPQATTLVFAPDAATAARAFS